MQDVTTRFVEQVSLTSSRHMGAPLAHFLLMRDEGPGCFCCACNVQQQPFRLCSFWSIDEHRKPTRHHRQRQQMWMQQSWMSPRRSRQKSPSAHDGRLSQHYVHIIIPGTFCVNWTRPMSGMFHPFICWHRRGSAVQQVVNKSASQSGAFHDFKLLH